MFSDALPPEPEDYKPENDLEIKESIVLIDIVKNALYDVVLQLSNEDADKIFKEN